jgi:hypothetical protein
MSSWGSTSVDGDPRRRNASSSRKQRQGQSHNSAQRGASSSAAESGSVCGGGAMSLSSTGTRPLHQRAANASVVSARDASSQQHLSDLSFVVCNLPCRRGAGDGSGGSSAAGALRTLAWVQSLKLPLNASAFHTLTLRRVSSSVVDTMLREIADIVVTPRDKRAVQRLWSTLCLHEHLLMQLPFLPYLCAAVARCIPNNPVAAFEAAMHFLVNMCADWMQLYPAPPKKFLQRVDFHLRATHPQLWDHLNLGGVFNGGVEDYLWVPLQTFFLYSFAESQWTEIFCEVVCRSDGMQYFYALATSLLTVAYGDKLLACSSTEEVHEVVTTQVVDKKIVEKVRRVASTTALQLALPAEPIIDIPRADDYYPVLHVGRRPPMPVIVDKKLKLSRIEAEEEQLQRRLKVELSTLVAAADVARFHSGAANCILGDGAERFGATAGWSREEPAVMGCAWASTRHDDPAGLVPSPLGSDRFGPVALGHASSVTGEQQLQQEHSAASAECTEPVRPCEAPQVSLEGDDQASRASGSAPLCATSVPAAVLTAVALLRIAERRSMSVPSSGDALIIEQQEPHRPASSIATVGAPAQSLRSGSLGPTDSAPVMSSRSNSHGTPVVQSL